MAQLTFQTPNSEHCSWEEPSCLAYNRYSGYCKFFAEFLKWDGTAHVRCAECMKLGKYGTATK